VVVPGKTLDVSLAGLWPTGAEMRRRPHGALSSGCHPRLGSWSTTAAPAIDCPHSRAPSNAPAYDLV